MPALVFLWSKIPAYQWLSRILTLPVLRPLPTILYDHLIAPSLAFWALILTDICRRTGQSVEAQKL
jgi:hypothetical protein